jgi:uncharacterized protein YcbX
MALARGLFVFVIVLLLIGVAAATNINEPRTGISFPERLKRAPLSKLGVRTKGPIKVYAVGQYGSNFMLKMAFSVGAQKMSSALVDALKPRCKGSCSRGEITEFETLVLSGLPNGAPKGTEIVFGTGGGKLTFTVNEKAVGSIYSKSLASAFEKIYTDKNAVCVLKPVNEAVDEGNAGFFDDTEKVVAIAVIIASMLLGGFLLVANKKSIKVCELNIYPVKSCAEQRLGKAKATARGFVGDRIAQITDKNGECCTSRDQDKARLFQVAPIFDGGRLHLGAPGVDDTTEIDLVTTVSTPVQVKHIEAPNPLRLDDYGDEVSTWLEKATDIPGCRLSVIGQDFKRNVYVNEAQGDAIPNKMDAPVSLADEAPYLLTSETSLTDLNRRLVKRGKKMVDMRRFRPNIVISGLRPWEEDTLRKIRIGGVEFLVWQRCGRCTMTTIDRDTLERGPEPLATLSTFRERSNGMRNFGMHLIPVPADSLGSDDAQISVGDTVEILDYDDERRSEWEQLFGSP